MPNMGLNRRKYRDRLLELIAFERLETVTSFARLTEEQVETIASIALADIPDDPQDQAFVLLECLNLLIRDGQFARTKILATRLQHVSRAASAGRPFLRLALNALASTLSGSSDQAAGDIERGLIAESSIESDSENGNSRRDLAVAAAIKAALVDGDLNYARRARDLMTRFGDGLCVSILDGVLGWSAARVAADPLANLASSDPSFEDESLETYVRNRGIEVLFPSQITAIRAGLTTDDELTVSLPTSSGKTLLAEFKIAATLHRHPQATVIYVAPYRLLSRQVTREFRSHLSRLGHEIQDLGSGYDSDTPERVGSVLVCTPERLDSLLRNATSDPGAEEAFARCRLVVFDEMHLIGRPGRGPRFEMLLTRLKLRYSNIRFLALSAANQGVDEVADWLTSGRLARGARRPTGTIEVAWRTSGKLAQRIARQKPTVVGELERTSKPLVDAVRLISNLTSDYQPVLAVCVQRAYAESLATLLVEDDPSGNRVWIDALTDDESEQLENAVEIVASMMGDQHPLTRCLQKGVGFHHAGVPTLVLGIIEDLARNRVLRAVSATTTVAEGADLPFRAVVIPHLNFQSGTRKLERDLYLNIIGRAGRVNVSMEGIVFILDSDAKTIKGHISSSLWTDAAAGRVRGQLSEISETPSNPDESTWYGEYESQVMGWLGDGESYHEDQATLLASGTFTFQSGNLPQRRHVESLTQSVLDSLESRGFAVSGSPLRLTERGARARLTGLCAQSVVRIESVLEGAASAWFPGLVDVESLSDDLRGQIARTVYESTETIASSLWLRRAHKTASARTNFLSEFGEMNTAEHLDGDVFWAEVHALELWIAGESLDVIAGTMPTFGGTGLFGSADEDRRVSDVAEYVSRIGYPGSWTWTAVQTLARESYGLGGPAWISGAIELGAPNETAVNLMRVGALSRPGSLRLAAELGPSWNVAVETLREGDSYDSPLAAMDQDRLHALRDLLQRGDQ